MKPARPKLEPGRVYRTRDLAAWSANAPRLARRLVREGELVPLAHGLFAHQAQSRFGPVPPRDEEIMRGFLDGGSYVFSGPERWNALGLGTTAMFAVPLVPRLQHEALGHVHLRQPSLPTSACGVS